ncbi:aldose 1-epimerase [Halomonas urumqiensis]|uniref:Aldose 1-epimerase n=1 Tax=Halomonas urumqiensis TaxID=1684789 RepID=A0A2N7UD79_9GAMM|nr:aldose 1-epimerase [Halomonas urumqiensis]PMR78377.1 aldose 1-epimerase [Halomonas urumqiensis]PTB03523.1 aldose 1-epimerase [Halomonas urumqiensis]GHE20283.1 aldose 1-epimerase [Halomonas urumqiensis]
MCDALTLDNGHLRLVVAPGNGACVVRFDALTPAGPVPIFRPGDGPGDDPNRMGLYPLLPWSNRISGGGFTWRGRDYSLAPNLAGEPLPIHGDGWQQSWRVVALAPERMRLALRSAWQSPFDYKAVLDYRLQGKSLVVDLCLTHLGLHPAPYGVGMHPWFSRTADVRLSAPAGGVWEVDATQLPTHWRRLGDGDPWRFTEAAGLPERRIDNLFSGWNGRARMDWPQRGVSMALSVAPRLSRYLVFSPGSDADFFCFEPVSHVVDAHHFPDPLAEGLSELASGERLGQRWRFGPLQWNG